MLRIKDKIEGRITNSDSADMANKLTNARTFVANLSSNAVNSFDGTKNIEVGIKGILPVANGGTGNSSVDTLPTSGSTKMLTSDGIYNILQNRVAGYKKIINLQTGEYDDNKYYAVVSNTAIPYTGYHRIILADQLDGNKPTWGSHSRGFTANFDVLTKAGGWGSTNASSIILDESFLQTPSKPFSFEQLVNSSKACFYLRGGAHYTIYTDYKTEWTILTETTTYSNQEVVSPVDILPDTKINKATIYCHLDGNAKTATTATKATSADKLTTKRTMVTNLASTTVNSFDGSGNIEVGVKNTLSVKNGGTGQTNLGNDIILVGNGSDPILTSNLVMAKSITCHLGTTPQAGWRRVCKIAGIQNYGSFLVFFHGSWSMMAPTVATFEVGILQNTSNIKLLGCTYSGFVTKIRLVYTGTGGQFWLDFYSTGLTSGSLGDVKFDIIGNVKISDIVTTNPNPPLTTEETSNSECTFRKISDRPTITLQDADGTNKATAVEFTGADIVLKLPSKIRGTLTGNADTATKLQNSRNFKVEDNSATNVGAAVSFNGSGDVTMKLPNDLKVRYLEGTKIRLLASGSSWLSGKTMTNASIGITNSLAQSSYSSIIGVTSYGGNVLNFGGLGDNIGFYGYYASRTDNGTDFSTVWDTSTGKLTHNKDFAVSGVITQAGHKVPYSNNNSVLNISAMSNSTFSSSQSSLPNGSLVAVW